ncbi:MAG: helix-turn-helix domain-containing protein [Eubacteriales bacterium]
MKTWDDYKEHAKARSNNAKSDIEEAEELAYIVSNLIQRRNELKLSQRDLAMLCGLPQSSIARFETMKTVPNIDTVIKIMKPLGLHLTITSIN